MNKKKLIIIRESRYAGIYTGQLALVEQYRGSFLPVSLFTLASEQDTNKWVESQQSFWKPFT